MARSGRARIKSIKISPHYLPGSEDHAGYALETEHEEPDGTCFLEHGSSGSAEHLRNHLHEKIFMGKGGDQAELAGGEKGERGSGDIENGDNKSALRGIKNLTSHGHEVKHPGFKAVQSKIAAKQGLSQKAAGAILAARSRGASASAHKMNPRLNRVKG